MAPKVELTHLEQNEKDSISENIFEKLAARQNYRMVVPKFL